MPKKLDRCVKKLIEEGHDEDSAWAICQSSIKKGVKMKKAVVLKSMRTESGAKDWARLMNKKYPNAKVVDSETLKSFGSIDGLPPISPPMGMSHVILEEDLSPVVNVLKKGEAGEIVKALVSKGFMTVDGFGPKFSEKWHGMIDEYVSSVLKDAFKSTGDFSYDFDAEVNEYATEVLKSLEDATMLASMEGAPENAEHGHALRDNTAISDEEAGGAFEGSAPAADTRDPEMDPEAVSDAEVESAEHESDHNAGKEVLAQPSNTARKSVEAFDDYMYITFKSVDEARQWKNPDMGVYQVVPVSAKEREMFGEDAKYVVRGRHEWFEASILKSASSTEADDRTQGLTDPESADDDGGTDDVEARAKQVDSKKKLVSSETLKGIIDDTVSFAIKAAKTDEDYDDESHAKWEASAKKMGKETGKYHAAPRYTGKKKDQTVDATAEAISEGRPVTRVPTPYTDAETHNFKSIVFDKVSKELDNFSNIEELGVYIAKCVRETIKENMSPKETKLDGDVQGTSKPEKLDDGAAGKAVKAKAGKGSTKKGSKSEDDDTWAGLPLDEAYEKAFGEQDREDAAKEKASKENTQKAMDYDEGDDKYHREQDDKLTDAADASSKDPAVASAATRKIKERAETEAATRAYYDDLRKSLTSIIEKALSEEE